MGMGSGAAHFVSKYDVCHSTCRHQEVPSSSTCGVHLTTLPPTTTTTMAADTASSSIPLYVIDGVATIWDAQGKLANCSTPTRPILYSVFLERCRSERGRGTSQAAPRRTCVIPIRANVTAVATAHCAYDISGLRAGTLPGVVQQNAFLGLPVTLMPEEANHLVKQGE